ncbi:hypothetical protein CYMTET_45409 [Cymbomonas tetramitiformis]|uniref:Uncharacterized protein n=1 Tax=Cymbomonas tetramitiformis TaxID=36881 RepID=A0AAE0EYC1_9CHLO|nr:hypothetical protein CYMTET_45409 [Cymbomonas tetramitiformis]|eukprot:gene13641-16121_t
MGCTASVAKNAVADPVTSTKSVAVAESVSKSPSQQQKGNVPALPTAAKDPTENNLISPQKENVHSNAQKAPSRTDALSTSVTKDSPTLNKQASQENAAIGDKLAAARKKLPPLEITNSIDSKPAKLPDLKKAPSQLPGLPAPLPAAEKKLEATEKAASASSAPLALQAPEKSNADFVPPCGEDLMERDPLRPENAMTSLEYCPESPVAQPSITKDLDKEESLSSLAGMPRLGPAPTRTDVKRVSWRRELETVHVISPLPAKDAPHRYDACAASVDADLGDVQEVPEMATSTEMTSVSCDSRPLPANSTEREVIEASSSSSSSSEGSCEAAFALQGRWQFSGFDAGILELTSTTGGKLTGNLNAKQIGPLTGSAREARVFQGGTGKEELQMCLISDEVNNTFRGWYWANGQPDTGCLWDATAASALKSPFAANWLVQDLGEGVNVDFNLQEAEGTLKGELIIPDEEGGVTVSGSCTEPIAVASLLLDDSTEMLIFQQSSDDNDTLQVWLASQPGAPVGSIYSANRAPDLDFIP